MLVSIMKYRLAFRINKSITCSDFLHLTSYGNRDAIVFFSQRMFSKILRSGEPSNKMFPIIMFFSQIFHFLRQVELIPVRCKTSFVFCFIPKEGINVS